MNATTKRNGEELTVVGLDTAKHVFAAYWVEPDTGEIKSRTLRRTELVEHFAQRARCLIAMEACAGAHHWARLFQGQGHEVRLLNARAVRAFVTGNKTDAIDARALWRAVQQPEMLTVAVKTEAQQAVLSVHRMRSLWLRHRVAQENALRGLLTEFGVVLPAGRKPLRQGLEAQLERLGRRLPAMLIDTLRQVRQTVAYLDEQMGQIELQLRQHLRQPAQAAERRIAAIPGVGVLTATAAVATMGRAQAFASGSQFAAWVGLVPRQSGTGGRVRLLGISKRGDTYLRTLLIHGARSALANDKAVQAWAAPRLARRPKPVVIVALANRMARTIWALLAHDRAYQGDYVSQPTAHA